MQARQQERRQARRIRRDADAVETEPTAQQHSVDGAALQLMQDTLRQQGELIASLQQQVEVMALHAEANKQGSTQAAHSEACHLDRLLHTRLTDGDLKELFLDLEPPRKTWGGASGPTYAPQYQMKVALLKVSGYNTYHRLLSLTPKATSQLWSPSLGDYWGLSCKLSPDDFGRIIRNAAQQHKAYADKIHELHHIHVGPIALARCMHVL